MNTNEAQAIINMTCEKVNDAVTKIQPLAEEVARQYQMRSIVWTSLCIFALFIASIGIFVGGKYINAGSKEANTKDEKSQTNDSIVGNGIFLQIVSTFAFLIFFILLLVNIGNAVAPMVGLLGK